MRLPHLPKGFMSHVGAMDQKTRLSGQAVREINATPIALAFGVAAGRDWFKIQQSLSDFLRK